jgi:hypothetical protein
VLHRCVADGAGATGGRPCIHYGVTDGRMVSFYFICLARLRLDLAFTGDTARVSGRFSGCSIVMSLLLMCWLGAGCWACVWDLGLTACIRRRRGWPEMLLGMGAVCLFVLLCLFTFFFLFCVCLFPAASPHFLNVCFFLLCFASCGVGLQVLAAYVMFFDVFAVNFLASIRLVVFPV